MPHINNDAVNVGVMGVREYLLTYYKERCIDKVISNISNNFVRQLDIVNLLTYQTRAEHEYQRREQAQDKPKLLRLAGLPILELHASPARIIFIEAVLTRSPQMKLFKEGITNFLDTYLPAVQRESNTNANITIG